MMIFKDLLRVGGKPEEAGRRERAGGGNRQPIRRSRSDCVEEIQHH